MDEIEIVLRNSQDKFHSVWISVHENGLGQRWLAALNHLLINNYHLEKNYCWMGWTGTARNIDFLCTQINRSVAAINNADIGYSIVTEPFAPENLIQPDLDVNHGRMNDLHRWFEDLQGWSGGISNYYHCADPEIRWHIRQLNLLCHETESLVLSQRKDLQAPEWKRPSQLMCWINAPRFNLEPEDYELFGIETINRSLGGVYVGVNKAVGKHHWEVFCDEGRDSRISELTTSALRSQTEAAGDFDIEWARDPGAHYWQQIRLQEFRIWLRENGFDPEEKALTIGHPQVGQVDLERSFGTQDYQRIWSCLQDHLDVYKIRTSTAEATYEYRWSDPDYQQRQIKELR